MVSCALLASLLVHNCLGWSFLSQCTNLVERGPSPQEAQYRQLLRTRTKSDQNHALRYCDPHLIACIRHTFWVPHVYTLCSREDHRERVVVVCSVCGLRSDSSSRSCRVVRINLLVTDRLERLSLGVQRVLWRTMDGDGCHVWVN